MKHRAGLLLFALVAVAGLLTTGCDQMWGEPEALVRTSGILRCGDPDTFDIIAGQHYDAGDIVVWNCTSYVIVEIHTAEGWTMSESHVAIADNCAELPRNPKGHLVPGNFPYQTVHDPAVTDYTYYIPLGDWEPGDTVALAVHVVVANGEQEETGWGDTWKGCFRYTIQECFKDVLLPDYTVQIRGWHPYAEENTYWKIELSGIDDTIYNVWNGYWKGWCSEEQVYMNQNTWYDVLLLSSQDPGLPDRCLEGPYGDRRWDCVNWLLNNKPVGATYTQLQNAVWYLTGEIEAMPGGLAGQMVNDALTYGTGFRPEVGDWIAVVMLSPSNVQLCFIEVDP